MKRTLTLALSAVLGGCLVTSAFGQDNFPDSPENHWAYEALLNLKKAGLLVGYPDGLFRGGRPASRYEMAVALNALYQHLKGLADGLGAKIAAIESRLGGIGGGTDTSGLATKAEVQALRDALNALKAQVDGMKASADDIAALKRMASTFERELASLGVDVEAMKKGLADLANRVSALEKHRFPVDIHGNVDLLGYAGYSSDDRFGITKEGRPTGVHKGDDDSPTGNHDFNFWGETSVVLETTNQDGPKARARIAAGNTMAEGISDPFGLSFSRNAFHQGNPLAGVAFGDATEMDIWLQELEISTKTSMLGADVNVRAGRIGKDTGRYFMRRPDTTLDYMNPYWDNHQQMFDGFDLGFGFGNVNVSVYGGRTSGRFTSDGTELWPMMVGNAGHSFEPGGASGNPSTRPRGFTAINGIVPDQMLGVNLDFPVMANGKINLQYAMFDSDSTTILSASPFVGVNRMTMFGGEVNFPLAFLDLTAGYSQTNLGYNQDNFIDEDNAAWWASLAWKANDKWGIHAGYRNIGPQFYAPGDWGRIGFWWNPNDVKGFNVGAWFALSDQTRIMASGEFLTGADQSIGTSVGLSEDDKVNTFKIRVEHKVNDGWSAMLGFERVNWDIATRGLFIGGEPTEQWIDLGFKFNFNENSWWSIMWQMSDVDGEGVVGFNPFSAFPGEFRATGGKLTSQFSVKY